LLKSCLQRGLTASFKHLNEFIEMPLLPLSHVNGDLSAALLRQQLDSPHAAPGGEGAVVAPLSRVLQPQSHSHLSIRILPPLLRCTAACMINNLLSPLLRSSRSCEKEDVFGVTGNQHGAPAAYSTACSIMPADN